MLDLSVLLRTLQLYAHHAHHIAARVVFNQDHDTLAEIYGKAETDYDNVIERFIGLKGDAALDENKVLSVACSKVQGLPLKDTKENKELLKVCLDLTKQINAKIEILCKESTTTQGTLQMLGDIADKNEVLVYKLQQRLK